MLLVTGVLAIGGLLVLLFLAQRYSRILAEQPSASPPAVTEASTPAPSTSAPAGDSQAGRALALVDRFIAVRRAVAEAIRQEIGEATLDPGVTLDAAGFVRVLEGRDRAIEAQQLEPEAYVRLRTLYFAWRGEGHAPTVAFRQAFERRREALESVELGPFESEDL